jgi:hypothetical protein
MAMLSDLAAFENLASSLYLTAPESVSAAGGGDVLASRYGRPTGAGFWSIRSAPEDLWEAMAREGQEPHRGNGGSPLEAPPVG